MAETRARISRTLALLPTLTRLQASGETASLADVAANAGMTTETLVADLEALRALELPTEQLPDYFEFEIDGDALRVLSVPLVLTDSTRMVRLTEPEAAALLSFIDEIATTVGEDADDALESLADSIAEAAGAPAGLTCWSSVGPVPDREVLSTLLTACTEGRSCTITYLGRQAQPYQARVDPYHLRLERGCWYAIVRLGDGRHAGQERVYRLDKISEAALESPYDPTPIDLDDYADGVFRPNRPPKIARVRFDAIIAPWADERWGDGLTCEDGRREFDIEYHDDEWLLRTLSLFGSEFEVIEPQEVRDAIVARCEDAIQRHDVEG